MVSSMRGILKSSLFWRNRACLGSKRSGPRGDSMRRLMLRIRLGVRVRVRVRARVSP